MTYITSNKTIKYNEEQISLLNSKCGDSNVELETTSLIGIPEFCRCCSQHPSNGGSGICFCILGQPKIT